MKADYKQKKVIIDNDGLLNKYLFLTLKTFNLINFL